MDGGEEGKGSDNSSGLFFVDCFPAKSNTHMDRKKSSPFGADGTDSLRIRNEKRGEETKKNTHTRGKEEEEEEGSFTLTIDPIRASLFFGVILFVCGDNTHRFKKPKKIS